MADHRGFEQSAIPQMPQLYNYALKLTMNSEDAKDLLQETYLKAYRFWNKFEEGTNIKGWLFRVMKNSYINVYRIKAKEPVKVCYEEYHLPYNIVEETSFVHKQMLDKPYDGIFVDEIVRSIDSIKDTFRSVIFLADVEGLSYEEIAKTVDCPVGTVRSRLHRGRRLLRQKLFVYARDNGYISNRSRS